MLMPTWSVVFLKTTRTATAIVTIDERGRRTISSPKDDTPARGIYAGEFSLDLESVPQGVDNRMYSALNAMCAKAAKAIGLDVGGSFAYYADEKARLLEVKPL